MRKRLLKYLEHKGISKYRFYKETGLSNGFLDKDSDISFESYEKISSQYADLDMEWVRTGSGSMLKSPPAPFKKITESEVEAVSMDSYIEVPFFDLAVTAGLPCLQGQVGWLDTRLVPARFVGKDIAVVRVSGDSMDDGSARSICHGDELVVQFEPFDLANGLPIRSKLFVVDTTEGAVVKQIAELNRSEGFVLLRSFNPSYPDYSLPLGEVKGFYSVQCFIYRAVRF